MLLVAILLGGGIQGQDAVIPAAVARMPQPETMHPYLRTAFSRIGGRLSGAGYGRVTATGTIKSASGSPTAITLLYEVPGKVKIQETGGATTVFDGTSVGTKNGEITDLRLAVLETMAADFVDQLFYASTGSMAMRFLGPQIQGDGAFYDVFKLASKPSFQKLGSATPARLFLINSETKLLDQVRYTLSRGGSDVQVKILYQNWTTTDGLFFPQGITRLENGVTVMTVTLSAVSFGAATADSAFSVQ